MNYLFIIIGVGGIGGSVARDLPKLLIESNHKMLLIDGDIVEEKNCKRQPYQKQDVKLNKARVLARKINSFYDLNCEFFSNYITKDELTMIIGKKKEYTPFFIGCVDNDATRRLIENTFLSCKNAVYIDGANSEYEANVYVSYKLNDKKYGPIRSEVYHLSNDKNPGLMSCEDNISGGQVQFLITNNKVASSILEHIFPFIIDEKNKFEGVTDIGRFKELHI